MNGRHEGDNSKHARTCKPSIWLAIERHTTCAMLNWSRPLCRRSWKQFSQRCTMVSQPHSWMLFPLEVKVVLDPSFGTLLERLLTESVSVSANNITRQVICRASNRLLGGGLPLCRDLRGSKTTSPLLLNASSAAAIWRLPRFMRGCAALLSRWSRLPTILM